MQLHQRKTRFNDITVTEDCGIRTLWSPGNVRQTAVLATDPTVPVLEYARNTLLALAFCEQLHTALVLGLGGGAIPRLLQRGNPGLTVDIVEIDPQMVEVAREYFAFRPANDLRVIVDDACRFIEAAPPASYDMVVLDAYLGMQMPAAMADQAAVHNLRRLLRPGGIAVANLMPANHETFRKMLQLLRHAFEDIRLLHGQASGNILGFAATTPVNDHQVRLRAATIAAKCGLRVPLCHLAERLQRPHGPG
jgi:spermidine synthase